MLPVQRVKQRNYLVELDVMTLKVSPFRVREGKCEKSSLEMNSKLLKLLLLLLGIDVKTLHRYVTYFEECVIRKGMRFPVKDAKVVLKAVHMSSVPHFDRDEGSDPYFIIHQPIYNREDLDNYHMEKLYDYSVRTCCEKDHFHHYDH